jgi:DUF177 domain-containing protein
MSGSLHAWYSLRDLESLGARQAVLSGEFELGKLPRFSSLLCDAEGSVRATLGFGQRREGWLTLELQYEAAVRLLCQRCLEPMSHPMVGRVALVVLDSDSAEPQLPEGFEPVELEGGRLSPAQLIEDELIVSLPLVPRHARADDCGSLRPASEPLGGRAEAVTDVPNR